ncbi:MAG: hypothetical protein N3C62_06820 [Synergistetes bacterium]|nr:hypothetical protein [Synergistota bacterium]MCX8128424.1 hypothetical protein [Synergistota bacterium]MDW8192576.1 hypothetical protein [Synergistota bacterium]
MKRKTIKLPESFYPSEIPSFLVGWIIYFAFLYFLVWIPGKFNYTTELSLGPFMIPWFVWTWIIVNILTIVGMIILYFQLKKSGLLEEKEG